jgi:hypothetical protein
MPNKQERLLSCPFCGGPAEQIDPGFQRSRVRCANKTATWCAGAEVSAEPAQWNTRAISPAAEQRVAESQQLAEIRKDLDRCARPWYSTDIKFLLSLLDSRPIAQDALYEAVKEFIAARDEWETNPAVTSFNPGVALDKLRQVFAEAHPIGEAGAREGLRALRQQVEDTIAVAETESDGEGFIKAYHFKTGAIHRLLALARQGGTHTHRLPAFHHRGCNYKNEASSSWECTPECLAEQDAFWKALATEAERQLADCRHEGDEKGK